MRDSVIMAALLVLLPLAISNTFLAYLVWAWAGLVTLNSYAYGFLRTFPIVMVFALITLFLVAVRKEPGKAKFKLTSGTIIYILLSLHAFLCALTAYEGLPRNWEIFSDLVKTLIFCALMPLLVTSRLRIQVMVLMIVMGFSIHGVLDGLKYLVSAGGHNARGVAKFGDNNYLAMALTMILPLVIYLYRYSERALMRFGLLGIGVLLVLAIVATNSRGGLLALVVVVGWQVLQSRRKVAGLAVSVACVSLVLLTAPASWFDRMNTMKEAENDQSFMVRVAVWKKSTAIALEHPVTGGGFYAVQSDATYVKFRDAQGLLGFIATPDPGQFAAHSIYFQVMGDMGFVGFFIYFILFLSLFLNRLRIIRMAREVGPNADWARDLANCLAGSTIAFLVGGALLSAAYLEIPFLIVGLMEVIRLRLAAGDQ